MRRTRATRALVAVLVLSMGCTTGGGIGTSGNTPDPARPDPAVDGASPADEGAAAGDTRSKPKPPGPIARRTSAAAEGAIIGTVLGGVVGPAGAAVGALAFGLYGLVVGKPPIDSGDGMRRGRKSRNGGDSDKELEAEIEERRQQDLEKEIEAELERQEELLEQISRQEELQRSVDVEFEASRSAEPLDPLAAPAAPADRKLPESIFDRSERKDGRRTLLLKTLDADRDGRPEIEIAYDQKSGQLLSRREDTDYDGLFDVENTYDERGQTIARNEDTNADGKPDRWTSFASGRATRVEVDRDGDGVRDGFYTYRDGWRAFEEHDTDNDGEIDRRVEYADHRRSLEIEDRDLDGRMEMRTYYGDGDVPVRAEIDRNGDGKPDVWEHYAGSAATQVSLERKEEDVNGDGNVDVTSYYSKGKLVRKEVSDPSLVQ
jgi:antitoxin component YwqK of YwqJK toxin-antitoxin module